MKKLTGRQRRKELAASAAIPDEQIDTSDIPELTDEQLSSSVRGEMYRLVKKPVTMRPDVDVIHWLKSQGSGYQTKANRLLRAEMLRSLVRPGGAGRRSQQGLRQRTPCEEPYVAGAGRCHFPWLGLLLNPPFQPTIHVSLATSQILRRPPGVT
jgi:uncharacterized protein (DUF4415 family)